MYGYPHKTAYRNWEKPIDIQDAIRRQAGKEASLYFHIPFCHRKCGYCNLFSKAGCPTEIINSYLDALYRQSQQLSEATGEIRFTSFAIGGGTPLLLPLAGIEKLIDSAQLFGVTPGQVFTSIETSPEHTAGEKLQYLREQRVKRISIGIQSFHERELKELKRTIPLRTMYTALEEIASNEFPQFNIDLIYGIEGQTPASLLASLKEALRFHPTELFVYPLYVRPGTAITKRADDATCMLLYCTVRDELLALGFRQTSMRRFVRDHTVDLEYSCGDETMISCGCGGRSYLGNLHTATPYVVHPAVITQIIKEYIATTDFTHITHGILLPPEEKRRRFIIKNLLYHKGIHIEEYNNLYGDLYEIKEITHLVFEGYAEEIDGYLQLTKHGLAWSDYIGQLFISPHVRRLMQG